MTWQWELRETTSYVEATSLADALIQVWGHGVQADAKVFSRLQSDGSRRIDLRTANMVDRQMEWSRVGFVGVKPYTREQTRELRQELERREPQSHQPEGRDMGAHNFTDRAEGSTVEDAYRNAVDQARWEHGNNGYNGTISTTSGVVDITAEYNQAVEDGKVDASDMGSVDDWEDSLISDPRIDKRGNCFGYQREPGKYTFFGWAAS